MKRCKKCELVKPVTQFYADSASRDGRRPECKSCTATSRKAWYRKNRGKVIARVQKWRDDNRERYLTYQREYKKARPEQEREGYLRRTLGITLQDYNAFLAAQSGGCAICGRPPKPKGPLHVDHDHTAGTIRGLLCLRCNNALGLFDEMVERLNTAADYLDSTPWSTRMTVAEAARQQAHALRRVAA